MKFELKELIESLDKSTKILLENAVQRCVKRGGNEILIEDVLFAMCEKENSFINALFVNFNLNIQELIDVLQSGASMNNTESKSPVFSSLLIQWIEDAYLISKLKLNTTTVSDSALILSLFDNSIKYSQTKYFKVFNTSSFDDVKNFLSKMNETIIEDNTHLNKDEKSPMFSSELEKFTTNLTQLAKNGEIDPVLCRDEEIKQAIDILLRRRKNNPIMVGEAGVGKTAVVEGLALKIVNREVPDCLYDAHILSLDLGALQAGASIKGEFERRLQTIIEEIQNSPLFIILFIDEAHTLIGDGGSGDAANLLKPALARGKLRTIAATTWIEYRKYFEKDAALSRRFQKIDLLEPSIASASTILRGLANKYEEVHEVYIEDEALDAAVTLSARYITGRQLPDKAIDVLDTACANVKISKTNLPFALQKVNTLLIETTRKMDFFKRDDDNQIKDYSKEIKLLSKEIVALKKDAIKIEKEWSLQKDAIFELEKLIKEGNKTKIEKQNKKIEKLQSKNQYISLNVTKEQIAEVISSWTGIPLGNIVKEQVKNMMNLDTIMKQRIIGQDDALSYMNQFLRISTAGLKRENSPLGVFLLVGPSGVGKTETALSIADIIFGGERFITTINMTEFQEKHTVSRLIGSPPGYVGYGDGGQLTDPVRLKPYSVVLLDEIEKAHPDVLNIFYQLFDKGILNDGEGKEINFRNTIVIMTSNLATPEIAQLHSENENITLDEVTTAITPVLTSYLQPALLGRMNIIPYAHLKNDDLKQITKLKLNFISAQLAKKEIQFSHDDKLLEYIVEKSNAFETGARNIELIINTKIMPELSKILLEYTLNEKKIKSIKLSIDKDKELFIKCQ
jgi:type VI secretion system protein VasG